MTDDFYGLKDSSFFKKQHVEIIFKSYLILFGLHCKSKQTIQQTKEKTLNTTAQIQKKIKKNKKIIHAQTISVIHF